MRREASNSESSSGNEVMSSLKENEWSCCASQLFSVFKIANTWYSPDLASCVTTCSDNGLISCNVWSTWTTRTKHSFWWWMSLYWKGWVSKTRSMLKYLHTSEVIILEGRKSWPLWLMHSWEGPMSGVKKCSLNVLSASETAVNRTIEFIVRPWICDGGRDDRRDGNGCLFKENTTCMHCTRNRTLR